LRREPEHLGSEQFDLAVVGGGIHGAWVALDAARRGLKTALIEQGDFGQATSANSQRIVHGGLRYLQRLDLKRFRESVRERATLLRLAPHLVRPLPVLVPTGGRGMRSRVALLAALKLNDWLSAGRNRDLDETQRIPDGSLVGADVCLRALPAVAGSWCTGGALFHDAQVLDSERLCLAVLRSAREAGAEIANHVKLTRWLADGSTVVGFEAEDLLGRRSIRVFSRLVVTCVGPWIGALPALAGVPRGATPPLFRAVVLATRPFVHGAAIVLAGGERSYFATPWGDRTLVGTFHAAFDGDHGRLGVSPAELETFLDELRTASPPIELRRSDVSQVFVGVLPRGHGPGLVAAEHYRIIDHEREQQARGRLSVIGVKWTTARHVAEETVTLAFRKLGRVDPGCTTASRPLHGAAIGDEVLDVAAGDPALSEPIVPGRSELAAEVVHGVRIESARTLSDVIFRRTGLGTAGWPGRAVIERCAALAGRELGWDASETAREIAEVEAVYDRVGVGREG
jgi:glycerol-3-phosphate dehydrogenase